MPGPPFSHRAQPNTTVDIYTGPLGIPPNALRGMNIPVRFVTSSEFTTTLPGTPPLVGYITIDLPILRPAIGLRAGAVVGPYNLNTADQIAIVSGGPHTHGVVFTELFFPASGIQYCRGWLCLLPY